MGNKNVKENIAAIKYDLFLAGVLHKKVGHCTKLQVLVSLLLHLMVANPVIV
jgi:hypothetical protein